MHTSALAIATPARTDRQADDAAYYRRRAAEEQVKAQTSACDAARERHEELATMYRLRAAMLTTPPGNWAAAFDEVPDSEVA